MLFPNLDTRVKYNIMEHYFGKNEDPIHIWAALFIAGVRWLNQTDAAMSVPF
jgi:hypothetical protein